MNASRLLLISGGLLLAQASQARAECPYLIAALKETVSSYREIEARNLAIFQKLEVNEKECTAAGAEISFLLAKETQGNSCSVSGEVAKMRERLSTLSVSCKETSEKMQEVHLIIEEAHAEHLDDLSRAVKYQQETLILQEECPQELRHSKELLQGFVALAVDVAKVKAKAESGTTNFQKFSKLNDALGTISSQRADSCGGISQALHAFSGGGASGMPSAADAAKIGPPKANTSSDITGTGKDAQLLSSAASVSLSRPVPNGVSPASPQNSVVTGDNFPAKPEPSQAGFAHDGVVFRPDKKANGTEMELGWLQAMPKEEKAAKPGAQPVSVGDSLQDVLAEARSGRRDPASSGNAAGGPSGGSIEESTYDAPEASGAAFEQISQLITAHGEGEEISLFRRVRSKYQQLEVLYLSQPQLVTAEAGH